MKWVKNKVVGFLIAIGFLGVASAQVVLDKPNCSVFVYPFDLSVTEKAQRKTEAEMLMQKQPIDEHPYDPKSGFFFYDAFEAARKSDPKCTEVSLQFVDEKGTIEERVIEIEQ